MTIKEARTAAGLTQAGMSDMLGIPKRTIESWEQGTRIPPEWLERLIIEKLERIKEDTKMYRIKEIETNVIYDDVYASREDAKKTIAEYKNDDEDERIVQYALIDSNNNIVETY